MLFVRNASALPARAPTAAGPQLYGRFFLETQSGRGCQRLARLFLDFPRLRFASENDAIWMMGMKGPSLAC